MSSGNAPDAVNYLKNNSFKFTLNKIPNTTFYIQQANIPSISVDYQEIKSTYAQPVHNTGGRITYGELSLSFIVDEDLKNYLEIFNWIRGEVPLTDLPVDDLTPYEDGSLIILNNSYRPNVKVTFDTLFPISIDGINFDLTTTDPDPILVTTLFKFNGITIKTIWT